MFNSIKNKMMLFISCLILVLLVGSSLVTYNQSRNILEETISDAATRSAKQNAKIITQWLEEMQGKVSLLTDTDIIKSMNWKKQKSILLKLMEHQKDIESMFIADSSGKYTITAGKNGNISDRDYFQKLLKTEKPVISNVIISEATGRPVIVVGSPIFKDNQLVGMIGANINPGYMQKLVKDMKIDGYGYGWIVNSNLKTVAHPKEEYLGNKKIFDGNQSLKEVAQQMNQGKSGLAHYKLNGVGKVLAFAPIELTGWSVAMTAETNDVLSPLTSIQKSSLIVGIVAIIVGLVVAYLLATRIANPIEKAVELANKFASKDLTATKIEVDTEDEIGDLVDALNRMRDSLRDIIVSLLETIENLSAYSEELSASAQEGNATIETTNQLINDMSASIQQISASAQEVTSFAQKSTDKTQAGSENIDQTISSIDQIKETVEGTVDIINDLDSNSQEIGQIVDLINNIAEQTNLLALNAAIEAARAGSTTDGSGQGFAVVADEIRELAEETNQATEDIKELIEDTQAKSTQSLEAIEQLADITEESQDIAQQAGDVFSEIEEVSQETTVQIKETANATQNLSQNSNQVIDATEDIGNISDEITDSSQELASMAQQLQQIIDDFKV
ncbi:methyl-accepting chemotaxis protein [Halanaerocella petrolearia]